MVALNQDYPLKKTEAGPKNRTRDFFPDRTTYAGQTQPLPRIDTRENYDTCRRTASGHRKFANGALSGAFTFMFGNHQTESDGEAVFAPDTPSQATDASGARVQADLSLTSDGIALDDSDTFTVKAHGHVGVVIDSATNQRLNGTQLGQRILSHPEYANSTDCVLYICNAGIGSNSVAQQVADTTGLIVTAGDGWVGQFNHKVYAATKVVNGRTVGDQPFANGVGWKTYYPKNMNRWFNQHVSNVSRTVGNNINTSINLPSP